MVRIGYFYGKIRKFCTVRIVEMKYLNVAEKNDAAKTIAGFLSNGSARRREGYSVYNKIYEFETNVRGQNVKMVMTSVSGHLMSYDFVSSYRGWSACDPQQLFDAPVRKACIQDNEPIKKTLEREIKSCQGLIIWTDCDREGENIGFEIIEVCKAAKPNIRVFRAKFSEITATSARRALANMGEPDERQSAAVDVRQELDLRTGAAFTRYQTMRLQRIFPEQVAEKLISYGSCQIPTMGFVAARYKEAEDFVSEPFWKIKVTHTIDDLTVEFNWDRNRLFDKEACEDYLLLCLTEPTARVDEVTVKPKNKWRPVALDTVELEKLGSRKLKINAKTVLSIAEKLYQQGYISYPRTETNQFSKEINLRALVENHTAHPDWGEFASRVLEWGVNPRNGNKSDEAHPPIHPIKLTSGLSGDDQRVYELIVRHFLACVSKDATGSETIVKITIAGEKFHANGLCIYERNYLDVYPYEKWNAKQIHRYEIGQTFEPTEITMQEGATTAPPLLTEADLIALMDKHGIGTDATHAEHINTVKERGYIGEVERGLLVPGTIGMGLYEGYHAIELPLAEPFLRAEFENDLKKICTGEANPKQVLEEQIRKYKEAYRVLNEKIRNLDEQLSKRLNEVPQQDNTAEAPPTARIEEVLPCPKCSHSSLLLKRKKDNTNFFLSCARYPDCKNTIWFSSEIKSVKVSSSTCPKCGPKYNLLEFKFKQITYLALLNASHLTYSTCIVCDRNFQKVFDVSLDKVKRVGAIVSDQNIGNQTRVSSTTVTSSSTGSSSSVSGGNRGGMFNRNPNTQKTLPNSRKHSSLSLSGNSSRGAPKYRGWGDYYSKLNQESNPSSGNEIQPSTTNSNVWEDDFDDIFLNDDLEFDTTTRNTVREGGSSNLINNRETSPWNSSQRTGEVGEISTTSVWSNRDDLEPRSNNRTTLSWGSYGGTVQVEGTFRTSSRNNQNNEPRNDVRCKVCNQVAKSLIVRKDGPNKGRHFFTCKSSCSFFQWADEVSNTETRVQDNDAEFATSGRWRNQSDNSSSVLCSCNNPANERTVRKEGPNKGRQFYVCAKQNASCDFFKWADENTNPHSGSAHDSDEIPTWGTGRSHWNRDQPSTSRGTNSSGRDQPPKRRRCGICRQEGHTRVKCPRQEEFGDRYRNQ